MAEGTVVGGMTVQIQTLAGMVGEKMTGGAVILGGMVRLQGVEAVLWDQQTVFLQAACAHSGLRICQSHQR